MSIANGVPQVELPSDYPSDMAFRLQDREFLSKAHDFTQAVIPQLGVQQTELQFTAYASLDSIALVSAIDFGASVYATAVGMVTDPYEYEGETAQIVTLQGVREFERYVQFDETTLLETLRLAKARMEADAPHLTEVVEEVTGHYYAEKGYRDLALLGAGAMRGFHILVNKRLIANRFNEDEAEALLAG